MQLALQLPSTLALSDHDLISSLSASSRRYKSATVRYTESLFVQLWKTYASSFVVRGLRRLVYSVDSVKLETNSGGMMMGVTNNKPSCCFGLDILVITWRAFFRLRLEGVQQVATFVTLYQVSTRLMRAVLFRFAYLITTSAIVTADRARSFNEAIRKELVTIST